MPSVDPHEDQSLEHATLAPSAASRWVSCPASVRMEQEHGEDHESVYAREGTAAHAVSELYCRRHLLGMEGGAYQRALAQWRDEYADVIGDNETEMLMHAMGYASLLRQLRIDYDAQLLLEQRMPTGVPGCWGTADAVLVSPKVVHVVDLKYGAGVRVQAEGNHQLRLYGAAALETYGDLLGEVETVRVTVYQPRLDHVDTEGLSADELRAWRDSLIPVAEEALSPDARFGPSDEACRWCSAAGVCSAQMQWATALDFGVGPEALDDEDLAEALEMIPGIRRWCDAVAEYALDRVYSKGEPIPGWKVVMSGGRRSIVDPDGAIEALSLAGYDRRDITTTKPKGIGQLEKVLGADFQLIEPYIEKSSGKPSLVPASDPRSDVNPDSEAASVFDGLDEIS